MDDNLEARLRILEEGLVAEQQRSQDLKERLELEKERSRLARTQNARATGQLFLLVFLAVFGLLPALILLSSEFKTQIPVGGSIVQYEHTALIDKNTFEKFLGGLSTTVLSPAVIYLGLWVSGRKDMADEWLAVKTGVKRKND